MHDVVVLFDLLDVHRVTETRCLEQVLQVGTQYRHVTDHHPIGFEVPEIDCIETHKGGEQSHVSQRDVVTDQVAAGGEPITNPVHCAPQISIGVLVAGLVSGETAPIDTVVDVRVDLVVDGFDFVH